MFPTREDTGGLRVPLVSFTGRDPWTEISINSALKIKEY